MSEPERKLESKAEGAVEEIRDEPWRAPGLGMSNSEIGQQAALARSRRGGQGGDEGRDGVHAVSSLRAQYEAAISTLRDADKGAELEDTIADQRKPPMPKVKPQIQKLLDEAWEASRSAGKALEERPTQSAHSVFNFESRVDAVKEKYLSIALKSKDKDPEKGEKFWKASDEHDYLGSDTFDARLCGTWKATKDTVFKFAVPAADARAREGQDPKTLTSEIRIGTMDTSHVAVAGGSALAAGLLRFHFDEGTPKVYEIENTSGGFRPGPLRNSVLLEALSKTRYSPATKDDADKQRRELDNNPARNRHNATGDYNPNDLTNG